MKQYERELAKLAPAELEARMELVSIWERKGIHEGKEGLVIRQLNRRFGSVAPEVTERLDELPIDKLDELGVALLDFASLADLELWLSQQ